MAAWTDFIKTAVRPFIIVWGAVLYGVCILKGIAVPDLLAGLVAAIIIEYFGERAVFRFRENAGNGDGEGKS
jgi:hypothetical protein